MYHDLPFWAYIVICLSLSHVTIAAVTIYLHRNQTHRALSLHPLLSHFFRAWLWLTTGIVTREWVAIHRKHHAKVETESDPHSPQCRGILKVLLEGAELYREEAKNKETLEKYGFKTPEDGIERCLYSRYSYLGIVLMLLINIFAFGAIGLSIWAMQMIWIPIFAAGVINGLGHWWGYRNFESADASTNILPLGLFIGGEELHNNHHAFASSARFSSRWYEFDLGWTYIVLLQFFGLASVKKLAPKLACDKDKQGVDQDTVSAVISNRLHILSDYARDVVGTVYREEKAKANNASRTFFRRGKRWINRHETLLDYNARVHLQELLDQNEALNIVYEYRQRLQELWMQKSISQEAMLVALQEWCQQAEESGIKALQDFAATLRSYSMAPV